MRQGPTLGELIRQRRLERGWSQEELAERISTDTEYVRQSEISRLERGRVKLPRRGRLERIADVLDLPLGQLLAASEWSELGDVTPAEEATRAPHREPHDAADQVVDPASFGGSSHGEEHLGGHTGALSDDG